MSHFQKHDKVRITYRGKTVTGAVALASANGRSLMLAFDALLGGYAGAMPVSQVEGEEEYYVDLVTGERVDVALEMRDEAAFTCPKCGAVSHNRNDVREGYCGRCHDWTGASDGPRLA